MTTEFIELAGKVKPADALPLGAKAQRALHDTGLSVKGARIAVLGVSYKPGVGDVRRVAGLKIISLLLELGAEVPTRPHVASLPEFSLTGCPRAGARRRPTSP